MIAYTHHEKLDGSGYPNGLKGEAIPLEGRIVATIDTFDTLASKRIYKQRASYTEALNIIKKSAGSSSDPNLINIFIKHKDDFI